MNTDRKLMGLSRAHSCSGDYSPEHLKLLLGIQPLRLSEAQAQQLLDSYREKNPAIAKMWSVCALKEGVADRRYSTNRLYTWLLSRGKQPRWIKVRWPTNRNTDFAKFSADMISRLCRLYGIDLDAAERPPVISVVSTPRELGLEVRPCVPVQRITFKPIDWEDHQ